MERSFFRENWRKFNYLEQMDHEKRRFVLTGML